MSDKLTPAEAEKEFWKSLKESNTGMLGIDRPGYHHQPMTGFGEDETGTIWFFTRDDTDFAHDVAGGGQNGMSATRPRTARFRPASTAAWPSIRTAAASRNTGTRSSPPGTRTARTTPT